MIGVFDAITLAKNAWRQYSAAEKAVKHRVHWWKSEFDRTGAQALGTRRNPQAARGGGKPYVCEILVFSLGDFGSAEEQADYFRDNVPPDTECVFHRLAFSGRR